MRAEGQQCRQPLGLEQGKGRKGFGEGLGRVLNMRSQNRWDETLLDTQLAHPGGDMGLVVRSGSGGLGHQQSTRPAA